MYLLQQIISPEAEENDRIIRVHNLKDANLKAGTGYNPLPEEIIYPFIDKRTIITKQINDTIIDYGRYHKFKWDMETQAFAMGPGKELMNLGKSEMMLRRNP